MTNTPIRIGFIGAGRMARLHASLIQGEPGVTIAAASDHGSGRSREFTHMFGGTA